MEQDEQAVVVSEKNSEVPMLKEKSKTKSHLVVTLALFLVLVAIITGAYLFFLQASFIEMKESENTNLREQQKISSSTITYSDGEIHFLDIQGNVISIVQRDTPYYDFTPVEGGDFMLPFTAKPAMGDFVFDEEKNYVFRLDQDWKIATTDTKLPRLYTNPRYTLMNKTGTCYISYLDSPEGDAMATGYTQSLYRYGFVSIYELQFDAQRLLDNQYKQGDTASQDRDMSVAPWKKYLPHEISVSSAVSSYGKSGLVLYAHDVGVVRKDCDEQFVGMLRTFEPQYMPTSFASLQDGTIELVPEYVSEGTVVSFTNTPLRFARLLWSGQDGIKKQAKKFNTAFSDQPVTVYKNMLYYLQDTVGLVSYNLFTNTETVLIKNSDPTLEDKGRAVGVNSFFMYKDRLYTLQGQWCNDYMSKCNLKLIESNLDGTNPRTLAEAIADRNILGFDAQTQSLYLSFEEGDAGCAWGAYHTYNFITNSIILLQEVSGCYGEGEEKPDSVLYSEQIDTKFSSQVQYVNQLHVVGQTLLPRTTASETSARNIRIRYITN